LAAAILTLPNRELAVISTLDLPKTKQTGAFKVDVSVYLDRKNKPSEKTALVAAGDINIGKDSGSFNGEAKFIYPSQPKVRPFDVEMYFRTFARNFFFFNLSRNHIDPSLRERKNLAKEVFSISLPIFT